MSENAITGTPRPDWRGQFVDAVGSLALVHGMSRGMLRVLGWMVVCEPDQQTASNIQDALGLSAGTVSVAVRALTDAGLLERTTYPGNRRIYHRMSEDGWARALEARFRTLTEVREAAERAIDASGGGEERLLDLRDTFARVEVGVRSLLGQRRTLTAGGARPDSSPVAAGA